MRLSATPDLPNSSDHGILQAIILEWVTIPILQWIFTTQDWTQVSCIVGRFLTIWTTREAQKGLKKPLYSVHIVLREYVTRDLHKTVDHKTTTDYLCKNVKGKPCLRILLINMLSTTNWHLPRVFASNWTTARAFVFYLYSDWTLCCCSCWLSKPSEGNAEWTVRHSVLQGNWWNRSLHS